MPYHLSATPEPEQLVVTDPPGKGSAGLVLDLLPRMAGLRCLRASVLSMSLTSVSSQMVLSILTLLWCWLLRQLWR